MDFFLSLCTIIGTIVGIISLIASLIAVRNTNNISAAMAKSKMDSAFKQEYKGILQELKAHIAVLNENDASDIVVFSIFDTICKIKSYANIGGWSDKKLINNVYTFIVKNSSDFKENPKLYDKLRKNIIDIKNIVEKEVKLHDS